MILLFLINIYIYIYFPTLELRLFIVCVCIREHGVCLGVVSVLVSMIRVQGNEPGDQTRQQMGSKSPHVFESFY